MSGERKTILVVDDNPAVASVVRFNLERIGYRVTVALDGVEAWRILENQVFDVVVTDQQMPHMDGGSLCRKLRETPEHAATPIVLLTAKAMEFDVEKLREECSIAAVFVKPFSPTELVRCVEQLAHGVS